MSSDSVSIAHAIGLVFFTRGFLLTRHVLENKSQCSILPDGRPSTAVNGCWHPRIFDKAVVIVIDALRYDFTVPFRSTEEQIEPQPYHNNLPLLYESASSCPEHAILLPFIADPPTSTLQRLKALTAGNLPTFIDIGSSFSGQAEEEDNILIQLNNTGKKIVHLGDDTWHTLFPGYFDTNLSRPYSSFDVWDLHTVDSGVIEHILPLLRDQKTLGWDVVFAHFLGVDHAGHWYGPQHEKMTDKLRQMNSVLKKIVELIDDRTLLVVMGDHGMDSKGDHGGESDDEIESALWMYSKKPRFGRLDPSHSVPPPTAKVRPVEQIDLASTLSLLLGLPIPFNNLGTPIAEAFVGTAKPDWKNLAAVNSLAFDQIQSFQREYNKSKEFLVGEKQRLNDEIASKLKMLQSNKQWSEMHQAYTEWHRNTASMFRTLWANFDTTDMLLGVFLSVLSLLSMFLLYRSTDLYTANDLPSTVRSLGLTTLLGATSASSLSHLFSFNKITGALYGGALMGLGHTLYTATSSRTWRNRFSTSIWGWMSLIFTITQAAGFASNSYTIHEDTILLFFLTTFGAFALFSSLRQASKSDRILGMYHSILFLVLTRMTSFSRLCREEQLPGCRSTFYASSNTTTSVPWRLFIPFVVMLVLPEIIKAFYKGTVSYAASAPFLIGFCFRIGLLLVALYWTIDAAESGRWLVDVFTTASAKTASVWIARAALAIAFPVGISTFIWAKPCVDISIVSTPADPTSTEPKPRNQITILGYANAFGTRYFLIVPVFVLATLLLLPPMGQFSFAILTWQILSLLEILDTNNLTVSTTSRTSSAIGPVVLAMLGSYHFFKTGHQAVISSIQWNSAFIPFRTLTYPFAPLLILFNTFGAQMLCAAAVPLTVLWKRPISSTAGLRGLWSDIMKASLAHVLYYATIQVATTMWAGHLRRHLMLYRVFMPRFLMGSVVLFVVEFVVIFVGLTGVRISAGEVGEIFGY